ncbi:MAG: nicotinate-nucleotide adenylyltransferase [Terrimicrobiaceae bacterium]
MNSHAIGLYGGSFDPIHNGHLLLARDAMERLNLERVIFLPAKISPHKLDRPPSPPGARLELLEAAISEEPGFEVDPRELFREGPSFTIDTIRAYRTERPEARLFYFIGDDNLSELHTWKDIAELKTLVQFVILTRTASPLPVDFPVISRRIEISSTEMRKRIARGASVQYMTPMNVCEKIQTLGLYRNE